jgi:Ca2+-transporting ATPase
MGPREWVISLAFGWVPLPLGALIRLVPNEPCERAFKKLQLLPTPELLPTTRSDAGPGSLFAMDQVRGTSAEHRMHGSSSVSCALPDPDGARLV